MTNILTPDQRLRVFVSSTLQELADERKAVQTAIEELRLIPVMFELGARPHPPRNLYRAYLEQSHIFVGIYWQRYGWIAPDEEISGLEDEYRLSGHRPKLIYVKVPAPEREERLKTLLQGIQGDDQVSYKPFATPKELRELLENDLALLLTERFVASLMPVATHEVSGSLDPATSGLPLPPTPLIGRERELTEVSKLLLDENVRLVTLVGPGGVGKSRLGLELAHRLQNEFQDGVWFVPLSIVTDPALVVPNIAGVLGIKKTGGPLVEALKSYLRDKHALLMLDNFEQLEAAAPLLSDLLAAAPGFALLVSSRSSLHLAAEHVYEVPPLTLPGRVTSPFETPQASEAVRLFEARAKAVKPSFALTPDNALAVAEACWRLDGLPLAIELAAARSNLLTPQALLKRLDQRFKLLSGGARDLPSRQQTLYSTIDWSYGLLTDADKRLFTQLGVFVGDWTLEAAEVVCSEGNLDVFSGLASLVNKSLVRQGEQSGEPRFVMLESIRAYALEKLAASGEEKLLRQKHAHFFLALAERAEPELRGPEQATWLEYLETEHGNLRAALVWNEQQNADFDLRLAGTLARFWQMRGYIGEGRDALNRALKKHQEPTKARAKALYGMSLLAGVQGDYAVERHCLEESLVIWRQVDNKAGMADAVNSLAIVNQEQGDYELARSLLEESLALWRELGDERGVLVSFINLGNTAYQQGDYDRASTLLMDGLSKARALSDLYAVANALASLGSVRYAQGDFNAQRALYEESLTIRRRLGDKLGVSLMLFNLGELATDRNDLTTARAYFEEALTLQKDLLDQRIIAYLLEGFARLTLVEEKAPLAAQLYGAAEVVREKIGVSLSDFERSQHERDVAALRARLDTASFMHYWNDGRSMKIDRAIELALVNKKGSDEALFSSPKVEYPR